MYRYIECNHTESDDHFIKLRHFDEVRKNPDVHVYRIKDITDAINTSVLLDYNQKEEYHRLLSDSTNEFDADLTFLEICENVGECDIH